MTVLMYSHLVYSFVPKLLMGGLVPHTFICCVLTQTPHQAEHGIMSPLKSFIQNSTNCSGTLKVRYYTPPPPPPCCVTHFAGSELPVQSPNHSHFAVIYFLHDISHGKNLTLGKSQRFLYHTKTPFLHFWNAS